MRASLLGLAASLLLGASAHAATLTFDMSIEFSGATAPGGAAPWMTATFDDSFGGSDTVRLTMTNTNLLAGESVAGWYFNLDPLLDPTELTITAVDITDSVPVVSTGVDLFKADGDGLYDILFDFPPPPGNAAARFTAGETVIFDITYNLGNLSAADFDFISTPDGGNGPFVTAAHVQGTGGGSQSGWVTTPEPSTGLLVVAGLAGFALRSRRER